MIEIKNFKGRVLAQVDKLQGADLRWADLRCADLRYADLRRSDLQYADLRRANLQDAKLQGAILQDAKLQGAILPHGETWEEYISTIVPTLLTYGGKTIEQIIDSGCWNCHGWDNCPMHVALDINSVKEAPLLIRKRVEEFVKFFDSGLIPEPKVSPMKLPG
jgi:hypothetical protein